MMFKCISSVSRVTFRKYSNFMMDNFTRKVVDLDGIIVALTTPFTENEEQSVDYEKLKENVLKYEKWALKGYCISGSYGERPYLEDAEKLKIVEVIKSLVHPSKLIIAGTTCESTEQTKQLSRAAAKAGANVIMVQTPCYFRNQMTDKVILEHFTNIANNSPIPVLVYNNPSTTGIDISLSCIETLADHPNICGVKDVDDYKLGCIVEKTRNKKFSVLAASAGNLLPAMMMGCSGSMNGLAAIAGDAICEMFALAKANEWNKALEIHKRLLTPDSQILRAFGPAGLKAAMDVLGFHGGICRKPMLPLNEEIKIKIGEILQASGFAS